MTLLELAETVIQVTGSKSEIVFAALPIDDPQVRQPGHHAGSSGTPLAARGRPGGGPAENSRQPAGWSHWRTPHLPAVGR